MYLVKVAGLEHLLSISYFKRKSWVDYKKEENMKLGADWGNWRSEMGAGIITFHGIHV